jgi:hypothetical protein
VFGQKSLGFVADALAVALGSNVQRTHAATEERRRMLGARSGSFAIDEFARMNPTRLSTHPY